MASRYWVGGSGTWDTTSTTNWSATSGGAAGASAPTSADDVFFDANSGSSYTVTLGENVPALTVNASAAVTATLAFGANKITLSGNAATIWAGTGFTVYTGTPLIDCVYSGATGTRTITPGGSAANALSVNVTAGTDLLDMAGNFGSLNFTGFSGTLNVGSRSVYGDFTASTGMTFGAGDNITTFASTSGTKTITSNGRTFNFAITFNGVGGTWQLQDNLTVGATRNVNLTNGTVSLNNNTFTIGYFLSTNANTRSIVFGTGKIVVSGSGTPWNVSGAGFTTTGSSRVELSYSGALTRTIYHGYSVDYGAAGGIDLYVTAGTGTLNLGFDGLFSLKGLDLTGFTGTPTIGASRIYGSVVLPSGLTLSPYAGSSLYGLVFTNASGTSSLTTNGSTVDTLINLNATGGTLQLQDALIMGTSRTLTLTNGTFNANDKNVSIGEFALAAGTKTLTIGSGTWTVAGANWNANTNVANFTVTASTGTISMTSASAKTFAGGAKTWPTLNQGGAGALTIQQSNTFANLTNTVQPATVTLTAGTTQTVTAFTMSGTSGNLITLNTTSAGSRATLTDSGGVNSVSFMSIKDIAATGYGEWQAYTSNGNVDAGNNVGWVFTAPSPLIASEYQISLKSFTERRSF